MPSILARIAQATLLLPHDSCSPRHLLPATRRLGLFFPTLSRPPLLISATGLRLMHDVAAASSAPPQAPAAALLAPGFRFHPTDEELVSYYLTRRVRGRALRVDAIAEVDLYKCEPWELPGLSRLRTRDLEWYFFSPLDRKYASRSRNSRTTAQGYWKTTGKDRPVRRGGRVVGMKKTLVYHSGRAPHGARTNWVMHEYRLEDDELAKFGVSQDAYVVCRIFQKNGAGPQNGAQYGAPFIEEEWEEDEKIDGAIEMMPAGGADEINDAHDQDFVEVNDFIHSQEETAATFLVNDNQQDSGNCAEDPTSFLDEIFQDPSFIDDIVDYINQSDIKGRPALNDDSGEQVLLEYSSHNSPNIDDGYLELNDMGNTINMDYQSSPRYMSSPLRTSHGLNFADGEGESINIQEVLEAEFLENTNPSKSSSDQNLQFAMAPVEDLNLLTGDPLNFCDCPSHQAPQDMVHYDAYNDPVALKPDVFTDQNEVLYPPVADQHDNDFDDEFFAYFDAIDDNLQFDNYVPLENFEQSPSILTQSNSKVHIVNGHANGTNPQLSDASLAAGAPSILPILNNQLEDTHEGRPAGQDVTVNRDNRKTITSHLINFLGSVSAPPAFASEFPASSEKHVGQISEAYKVSSLHVSPALVKLHDFTAASSAEDWLCKNGNTGLLLSYGLVDNLSGKTSGFGLSRKIQEWIASLLLRCGCYPFFLSGLVLTISYKLGMRIYEQYN